MFRSLRNRLILSHILPLLIILPLTGVGLIYVLETQVYFPALASELENDARFMARLTGGDEDIWSRPEQAQAVVDLYSAQNSARIMLLDAEGEILASSDPDERQQPGQVLAGVDLAVIGRTGVEVTRQVHYSARQGTDIIDVFAPARAADGRLLGFVRISYPFATLIEEIYQLRFLIFLLLALGLLIGSLVGYILAVSLAGPVRQVTQTISGLAKSSEMKSIPSYGPEEIQLLSQSVNDLVTRLREMEKSRRQLLANLVHEIGRPLGALRSAITALSGGAEQDPALYRDLLTGMDEETQQLQRLLNDLSHLHDQVLGTLELERRPIDLKVWLPEVLRTWQAAAEEKGIRWELAVPDGIPLVPGDPTRLAQIVGNLVSNAIKFTPTGGTVAVSVLRAPGRAGIAVRDSGPGMSAEEQEGIFRPFYRGKHGRRFRQGLGLGLSIARSLTEAHGGELKVESAPGEGSCFTVWLPVDVA